ncbi:MAG: DNA polymerase ligase N-terminal domain-containing protein, partial [Candidatus Xenobia bacterium]
MSLDAYKDKRDFSRTPEPGPSGGTPGQRFVVQRHHARRLHYDFRLEANGVLVSWAIPHGPSQDPKVKRMAVHVEDHPLDYGTFEGTIPKGNYGAGSVMVWDLGTYRLLGDGSWEAQHERGDIKLQIDGQRVRGEFALVRTHDNQWLLIKKKDAFAVTGWSIDDYATSVLSGRTQSEIAAGVAARPETPERAMPAGARERPMPHVVSPMLAERSAAFTDSNWWFELKWDGWRALTYLEGDELRILSRRANSLLHTFPELSVLRARIKAKSCILDGEIVCLDGRGVPDFNALQRRFRTPDARGMAALSRSSPVTLYLFDILYLDGWDLTAVPLEARRRLLEEVVEAGDPVRFSDYVVGEGEALFKMVCERGL